MDWKSKRIEMVLEQALIEEPRDDGRDDGGHD